jgi:ABC-type phosphate/phosphonate transport system substrate-binding protein
LGCGLICRIGIQNNKLKLTIILNIFTDSELVKQRLEESQMSQMIKGKKIIHGICGLGLVLGTLFQPAIAATLDFAIQPILSEEETRTAFEPLAEFIAKITGSEVKIHTARDFPEYWVNQKNNNPYEIMMDNAFFTDYRNEKENWVSIAKIPGLVSYTLIVTADNAVFETDELVGQKIASLMPPAPSGIFLGQMFRNPLRQPYISPTNSAEESLQALLDGKVMAAIIPTPLVNVALQEGKDLVVVKTSVQIPHVAISVSPNVPEETRDKLRTALLEADQNDAGKALLKALGFTNFEPADPSGYAGLMQYLIDFSFANE